MLFFTIMNYLQFLILSYFYWLIIKNKKVKRLIQVIPFALLVIVLLDLFKLEGLKYFNSISISVRTFILIIYAILYFLELLRDDELIKNAIFINSLPTFWFNSALFTYHCCSFLYALSYNFLQSNIISEKKETTMTLLALNYFAGIIQIILFYIGLSKMKKKKYEYS
ncbi:hypothetical protein [Chitinophaga nivalis]|uniref:Uncharacterized protein n=1 Tax=Chitinophaga nivalis TaxID=2991709 RepID=A0ABT3IL61_9BACT|nr:hypothetical protein [Chitinophaga nivalis]MCW3465598.1 hypothetical protein [Chitinophaga nivalis]MCW3484711.1 hypothetical protein [Chitinophaga nivalis]